MPSTPFHLSTSPLGARDINWESCEHQSVWTELYLGRYSVCIIWAVLGERATLPFAFVHSFLSALFYFLSFTLVGFSLTCRSFGTDSTEIRDFVAL